MPRFSRLLATSALVLLAACATPRPSTDLGDEEVAKLLVGRWDNSLNEGLRRTQGFDQFDAGGTFRAEATSVFGANRERVSVVTGTWKVQDGNIVETVVASDPPVHPPGTVYRLRVVSISPTELVTEGAGGIVVTRKRMK